MFCKNCGSQISDNAVVCPNCGVQVGKVSTENYEDKKNTIAIVGFVLSFFFAIAGLVCSIIGYKKAKNEGYDNQGLALAGIIISAISIGLVVLYIVLIIAGVSCLAMSAPYYF